MNHLINFYKNKAEQLQEKLNSLEKELFLIERYREFEVAPEFQNMLYPPAWYVNRGLPNPWDAMDPKTRSKELQRHIDFWTTRSGTNPVGPGIPTPNIPNLPSHFPINVDRERAPINFNNSNYMDEQVLYEAAAPSTANVFFQEPQNTSDPATSYYSKSGGRTWGVVGSAGGRGGAATHGVNVPQPPPGAVPLWLARWYWLFQNWNNPQIWGGQGNAQSAGSYLAWLMGQWGNPDMNYGRKWG